MGVFDSSVAVVILAAGMGTRMQSPMAKVLHPLGGRPLISYVVHTAVAVSADNVVVVVGYQAEAVKNIVSQAAAVSFALQPTQLGTGHAVKCALTALAMETQEVVILCGDVPLIRKKTLCQLIQNHRSENRILTLLGVEMPDPTGYGRIVGIPPAR